MFICLVMGHKPPITEYRKVFTQPTFQSTQCDPHNRHRLTVDTATPAARENYHPAKLKYSVIGLKLLLQYTLSFLFITF